MKRPLVIGLGVVALLVVGLIAWSVMAPSTAPRRVVDVPPAQPQSAPSPDPADVASAGGDSGDGAENAGSQSSASRGALDQNTVPETSRDRALKRLEALASGRRAEPDATATEPPAAPAVETSDSTGEPSSPTPAADKAADPAAPAATPTSRQQALARLAELARERSAAKAAADAAVETTATPPPVTKAKPAAAVADAGTSSGRGDATAAAADASGNPPATARERAAARLNALAAAASSAPAPPPTVPSAGANNTPPVTAPAKAPAADVARAPSNAASTAPSPAPSTDPGTKPATPRERALARLAERAASRSGAASTTGSDALTTADTAEQTDTTTRAGTAAPVDSGADTASAAPAVSGNATALADAPREVLERTDPVVLAETVASVEPARIEALPRSTRDRLDAALARAARAAAAGPDKTGDDQGSATVSDATVSLEEPAALDRGTSEVLAEVVAALPAEALAADTAPAAETVERALADARADVALDREAEAFIEAISTPPATAISAREADHFIATTPPEAKPPEPTKPAPATAPSAVTQVTETAPSPSARQTESTPTPAAVATVVAEPEPKAPPPPLPEVSASDLALGALPELPGAVNLTAVAPVELTTSREEPLAPHDAVSAESRAASATRALDLAAARTLPRVTTAAALRSLERRALRADDPLVSELLELAGANRPGALYYVRTVRSGDVQGIWGIIQSGLIDNFARGMAVRRGESLERYRVRIPRDADEPLSNASSSFLGRLIHAKTQATTVFNLEEGRLERNPDLIKPGQQIVIVDFTPEELTAIYRHFARDR